MSVSERLRQGVNQTTNTPTDAIQSRGLRSGQTPSKACKVHGHDSFRTLDCVLLHAPRPNHYHGEHARVTSMEGGAIPAASRLCRARGVALGYLSVSRARDGGIPRARCQACLAVSVPPSGRVSCRHRAGRVFLPPTNNSKCSTGPAGCWLLPTEPGVSLAVRKAS